MSVLLEQRCIDGIHTMNMSECSVTCMVTRWNKGPGLYGWEILILSYYYSMWQNDNIKGSHKMSWYSSLVIALNQNSKSWDFCWDSLIFGLETTTKQEAQQSLVALNVHKFAFIHVAFHLGLQFGLYAPSVLLYFWDDPLFFFWIFGIFFYFYQRRPDRQQLAKPVIPCSRLWLCSCYLFLQLNLPG